MKHDPYHIEAETKWPPFSRQHFQMDFVNENEWISIKHFAEVSSWGLKKQYSIIGLDNGLAPSRRQAIIWTNDG